MLEEVVYVLGTPGSNTVKIGRTTNLAKRLGDIQRMSPVPLSVLWQCPGGSELETQLHRYFASCRSHGEWFAFASGDPVALIRAAVETQPWNQKRQAPRQRPAFDPPEGLQEFRAAILAEVTELEKIDDLLERFRGTRALREKLAEAERSFVAMQRAAVVELKQSGLSWRKVGDLLGMSGARAEQIAKAA